VDVLQRARKTRKKSRIQGRQDGEGNKFALSQK